MSDERVNLGKMIGAKVVDIGPMERSEAEELGWGYLHPEDLPMIVTLSSGWKLCAWRDQEGNGPGALCIDLGDGKIALA